jgi:hypothetical protein
MATDQEIRDAGFKYIPQQKYLQNPYNLPIAPVPPPVSEGIVNTNAFTNSGGNDFNPAGNAFGYGSPVSEVNVRTFNPQSLPGAMTPGGQNANTVYNQAFKDLNDPSLKGMSNDFVGKKAQDVMDYANESIMDYRQNYGAQGQYISPYEDSMDLGYQGTLGNKGMLNRFKNKVGDVAKFAGGLLPFPLNLATKFLPKQEDRGPGGGTYGIAGLSDAQKEQYNALAGQGMLFNGQNGFKTLTGKNFNAKNYAQGQIDIYNKKQKKQGKSFAEMTEDEIAALTGFQKKQYLEASAMYKTTKAQQDKINDRNAAEAAAAAAGGNRSAQDRQRQQDDARIERAYREDTGGNAGSYSPGGGSGSHAPDASGSTYSDPFDPGGGEKDGGFIDGSNRRTDYMEGGRAGYFFGGRARLQGGGMSQGNKSNISQSTNMGGGITGDLSTARQTDNHDRAMRDNQNPVPKESILNRTMDLGSELSYLNNLKNLNVLGIVGNIGVNKFRNYLDNRKTTEENDKLSYNTNPLPTDNYFTEVQQKDLDASKMRGFKKQDYNSYLDQMNMLNDGTKVTPYEFQGLQDGSITTTGTFTAANGGRAMFKNGGLASIL